MLSVIAHQAAAHAREGDTEIGAYNEVSVDYSHQLQVSLRPQTVDVLERERFRELLSDAVRAELDVTTDQFEALKRLERRLAAIDRRHVELLWIALRGEPDERRTATITKISDEREGLQHDIDDILLPSQKNRLKQLDARKAIFESGVEAALLRTFAGKLNLDDVAAENVRAKLREFRADLNERRIEEYERGVNHVVGLLSAKQRESLAAQVGDVRQFLAPSLELLIWQAEQEPAKDRAWESSIAELLESPEHFRVDLLGSIHEADHRARDRFVPFSSMCYESAYGDLEIVKPQVMETAAPSGESIRQEDLLRGKLEQWKQDTVAGRLSIEKFTELANSGSHDLSRWRVDEFVGILLPHQRAELDRVVLRRLIAVRGLNNCCVDGTLGRILKLTENQKKQISDLGVSRAKDLQKTARSLETRIWAEVKQTIGPESAELLNDLIGPISSNMPGCPDLLLRRPRGE
jgi:hypothetical protein